MASPPSIVILAASVREGRRSDRVAFFLRDLLKEQKGIEAQLLDLRSYNFPVFTERLKFLKQPSAEVLDFAEKIKAADGIIVVTPEYNGGYPAALKNAIDLLYEEWQRKPLAICTVSSGAFAGSQVITSLLFTFWKIGAWVVPAMFPVPNVERSFTEAGAPADEEAAKKRGLLFIDELLFAVRALSARG